MSHPFARRLWGLGGILALAAVGGALLVESEPGAGTTVAVEVPATGATRDATRSAACTGRNGQVLEEAP